MANRAADWFRQGERDLGHAENARADGTYEWSCFAAHQAAEKALKAVYIANGSVAWGHDVSTLLRDLPVVLQRVPGQVEPHVLDAERREQRTHE